MWIIFFQIAYKASCKIFPVRCSVFSQRTGVDTDGRFGGEEISRCAWRGLRLGINRLYGRGVEDTLVQFGYSTADDNRIQRTAIGKGVTAKSGHTVGDVHFCQSGSGKSVGVNGADGCGKLNAAELGTFFEHGGADHIIFGLVGSIVSHASAYDFDFCQVQRRDTGANQLAKMLDIGTVNGTCNFQGAFTAGGKQCGQCAGFLHMDLNGPYIHKSAAGNTGQQRFKGF